MIQVLHKDFDYVKCVCVYIYICMEPYSRATFNILLFLLVISRDLYGSGDLQGSFCRDVWGSLGKSRGISRDHHLWGSLQISTQLQESLRISSRNLQVSLGMSKDQKQVRNKI